MDNAENIIFNAIKNRKAIQFSYNNEKRVVEPFALGVASDSYRTLLAYIVEGKVSLKEEENWRLYSLVGMRDVVVLDKPITMRKGYATGLKYFTAIICTYE